MFIWYIKNLSLMTAGQLLPILCIYNRKMLVSVATAFVLCLVYEAVFGVVSVPSFLLRTILWRVEAIFSILIPSSSPSSKLILQHRLGRLCLVPSHNVYVCFLLQRKISGKQIVFSNMYVKKLVLINSYKILIQMLNLDYKWRSLGNIVRVYSS